MHICSCRNHKAYGKGEVEVELFSFLASALDGMSGKRQASAALSSGKKAGTHYTDPLSWSRLCNLSINKEKEICRLNI
jgi:hypothetical protein